MVTPAPQKSQASEWLSAPAAPVAPRRASPLGLHLLALVTVLAACPLLLLGAEVTSRGVGMVDPQGFRPPWHLVVQLEQGTLWERGLGYLIEHAHRLAGFLVGTCTLLLAGGLWLWEPRRWVRGLGLAALIAVSLQGVLGIFRVDLNAWIGPDLALLHGCFAQLVFALLVAVAVVTSPGWWRSPTATSGEEASAVPAARSWGAWLLLALVVLQLVLGAWVRHRSSLVAARLHVGLAFGIVAVGTLLIREAWTGPRQRSARRAAACLAVLLAAQVLLGIEATLSRLGLLSGSAAAGAGIRSLHSAVGALVLATSLVLAMQRQRAQSLAAPPAWPSGKKPDLLEQEHTA